MERSRHSFAAWLKSMLSCLIFKVLFIIVRKRVHHVNMGTKHFRITWYVHREKNLAKYLAIKSSILSMSDHAATINSYWPNKISDLKWFLMNGIWYQIPYEFIRLDIFRTDGAYFVHTHVKIGGCIGDLMPSQMCNIQCIFANGEYLKHFISKMHHIITW